MIRPVLLVLVALSLPIATPSAAALPHVIDEILDKQDVAHEACLDPFGSPPVAAGSCNIV